MHVAALSSMRSKSRWFWPLVLLFAIPVVVALVAWGYQLRDGLQVTGLNNRVFWGFYITNLITFIGFSYGGALVSAILRLTGQGWRAPITRMAEATALVTLVIGALFIFADLGRPERVWEFFTKANMGSPLVWDAIAVVTYLVATVIFLYLPLIPDLAVAAEAEGIGRVRRSLFRAFSFGWRGTGTQRKVLDWGLSTMAIAIIPIAVTVHSVLSWAFAVTTRDGWHSSIFGPYFVVGALFSGVAMVILVVLAFRKAFSLEAYIGEKQIRNLGYIMLTLGVTYLYLTYSELLTEGYPMADKTADLVKVLLLGQYALQFWSFVVGCGVVPVLLVALPWTRKPWGIGTAAALVVAGMWLKRFLIVVPPQTVSLIQGPVGHYTPTWIEAAITLGGLFAIPLFLMLFFRLFPILSIHEMEELGESIPEVPRGGNRV